MKSVFSSFINFFKTIPANFKHRQLGNWQLRLLIVIGTVIISFILALIHPEAGSFGIFFGAYLATVAPDLGGLGLQKAKFEAVKANFKKGMQMPLPASLQPALALAATAPRPRTNTQRRLDARRAKRRK